MNPPPGKSWGWAIVLPISTLERTTDNDRRHFVRYPPSIPYRYRYRGRSVDTTGESTMTTFCYIASYLCVLAGAIVVYILTTH